MSRRTWNSPFCWPISNLQGRTWPMCTILLTQGNQNTRCWTQLARTAPKQEMLSSAQVCPWGEKERWISSIISYNWFLMIPFYIQDLKENENIYLGTNACNDIYFFFLSKSRVNTWTNAASSPRNTSCLLQLSKQNFTVLNAIVEKSAWALEPERPELKF